jgi:hypothetical protein
MANGAFSRFVAALYYAIDNFLIDIVSTPVSPVLPVLPVLPIQAAVLEKTEQQQAYERAREAYIQAKLNPTDLEEKARLAHRLTPHYSEKLYIIDDPAYVYVRKEKLAAYKKELEDEFDELERLKAEQNEIVETFVKENFKLNIYVPGWIEKDAAARQEEEEAQREKFIQDNTEQALLKTLRVAIRSDLDAAEIQELNADEGMQEILNKLYKERITERNVELKNINERRVARKGTPLPASEDVENFVPKLVKKFRKKLSSPKGMQFTEVQEKPNNVCTMSFAQYEANQPKLKLKREEIEAARKASADASEQNRLAAEKAISEGKKEKHKRYIF